MLDEHGTISPELLRRLMVAYGDVDRRDRAEVGSVLLYAMPTILARLDALAPLEQAAARVREARAAVVAAETEEHLAVTAWADAGQPFGEHPLAVALGHAVEKVGAARGRAHMADRNALLALARGES